MLYGKIIGHNGIIFGLSVFIIGSAAYSYDFLFWGPDSALGINNDTDHGRILNDIWIWPAEI